MDDTLQAGNSLFNNYSGWAKRKFKSSEIIFENVIFSGIKVSKWGSACSMHQGRYVSEPSRIPRCTYFEFFRSMRHKRFWLGHSRTDLVVPVKVLLQVTFKLFDADKIRHINQVVDREQNKMRSRIDTMGSRDPRIKDTFVYRPRLGEQ